MNQPIHGHAIWKCRCGKVVRQCRCADLNKPVLIVRCDDCKQRITEEAEL